MRRLPLAALLTFTAMTSACLPRSPANTPVDAVFGDRLPTDVVITVREEGPFMGFFPKERMYQRIPVPVLLARGSVILDHPDEELGWSSGYPRLVQARLDDWAMELVAEFILEVELPEVDREVIHPEVGVADSFMTVVSYRDPFGNEHTMVTEIGAAGLVDPDPRLEVLADLVAVLEDPPGHLGFEPFETDWVQAYAAPLPGSPPRPRTVYQGWPLPESFEELDQVDQEWRCAVYVSETAERLQRSFTEAEQDDLWEVDGDVFTIILRPVVPGESPCSPAT